MKIVMYSYRQDEELFIKEYARKYNVEIIFCKEAPSFNNVYLAKDVECISIITTKMPRELIAKFYEEGVRYISTRTIGYDHIDIESAREIGMKVGNVKYSANSVAEYTVMLILMALRNMKLIMERYNVQDYSLNMVQGRELCNLTVGVIGTGNIGSKVVKKLSGFDVNILAYDLVENDFVKKYGSYVALDELYKNSDIITLHLPATNTNFHMINKESIKLMKKGVYLINTARGSLINTEDLIAALDEGKIKGAACDVLEGEELIYYKDLKGNGIVNKNMALLNSSSKVLLTPHTAFYTDKVVSDMVENSIKNCRDFIVKHY